MIRRLIDWLFGERSPEPLPIWRVTLYLDARDPECSIKMLVSARDQKAAYCAALWRARKDADWFDNSFRPVGYDVGQVVA